MEGVVEPWRNESPSSDSKASESRYLCTATSLAWRSPSFRFFISFSLPSRAFFASPMLCSSSFLSLSKSSNFFSIVVFRVRSWFSLSSVCSALDRTRSKAASFFKHRPINPFIITIAKKCKREKRIRYSSKLGRRTERWWVGLPKRLQRGWTPPWLPWSGFPDHHNPSQRWWMRSAPRRAWSLHGGEWVVSLGCWTEPS